MSKNSESDVVDLFTGKKHKTAEDHIKDILKEGKFKDSSFALVMWKDETHSTQASDRAREYITSGCTYGTLLWELEIFKNSLMFGE